MANREAFDTWVLRIVGVLVTAGIIGGIVAHTDLRVLRRDVDELSKVIDETRADVHSIEAKVDDISASQSDTAGLLRGLGVERHRERRPGGTGG